jgi:hypothetical protein
VRLYLVEKISAGSQRTIRGVRHIDARHYVAFPCRSILSILQLLVVADEHVVHDVFSVFSPIGFHNLLEVRNILRILRTSSFPHKLACPMTNYSGSVANLPSQRIQSAALACMVFHENGKGLYKKSLGLRVKGPDQLHFRLSLNLSDRHNVTPVANCNTVPASQPAFKPASPPAAGHPVPFLFNLLFLSITGGGEAEEKL